MIEVSHVGLNCADYRLFEGLVPRSTYPRVMGREASGTVLMAGKGVSLALGQPVVVNPYISCGNCPNCKRGAQSNCVAVEVLGIHRDGAMCERITVPAENVYPVNGIPLADALVAGFLAVGARAVMRSSAGVGKRALVVGAGPIGLGTALFARLAGQEVVIADKDEKRLRFAWHGLGLASFETSELSVGSESDREGFDVVFDATGDHWGNCTASHHLAPSGTLVMIRTGSERLSVLASAIHRRVPRTVFSAQGGRRDFEHVIQTTLGGSLPVSKLVTHRATLDEAPGSVASWSHDKSHVVKGVILI